MERAAFRVYVTGLRKTTNEDRIFAYFKKFGEVVGVELKRNADGSSRCLGSVRFADADSAERAVEAMHMIDNKRAEVQRNEPESWRGESSKASPRPRRKAAAVGEEAEAAETNLQEDRIAAQSLLQQSLANALGAMRHGGAVPAVALPGDGVPAVASVPAAVPVPAAATMMGAPGMMGMMQMAPGMMGMMGMPMGMMAPGMGPAMMGMGGMGMMPMGPGMCGLGMNPMLGMGMMGPPLATLGAPVATADGVGGAVDAPGAAGLGLGPPSAAWKPAAESVRYQPY